VIEECYYGDKEIAQKEIRKEISKDFANLRGSQNKQGPKVTKKNS